MSLEVPTRETTPYHESGFFLFLQLTAPRGDLCTQAVTAEMAGSYITEKALCRIKLIFTLVLHRHRNLKQAEHKLGSEDL